MVAKTKSWERRSKHSSKTIKYHVKFVFSQTACQICFSLTSRLGVRYRRGVAKCSRIRVKCVGQIVSVNEG